MKHCIPALVACSVALTAISAQAQQPAPYPAPQPGAPQYQYPPQAPPPGYPPPQPGYPPQAPPPGYPPPPPGYPPQAPPGYPAQNVAAPQPQLGTFVPGPGYKTHDDLYIRLMMGPGYTNMSTEGRSFSGAGLGFELALGFALTPNFALFGDVIANGAITPTETTGTTMTDREDTTAFLQNFGVGAAYFIMPANIFVAGSLCAARLSISDTSGEEPVVIAKTDFGLGANFAVGKEWWVGGEMGIGAALQGALGSMSAGSGASEAKWTAWALSLAFTVTLN
jgi:hypothetical protein